MCWPAILDPKAFGVVAIATVFTGFANLFTDLGLGAVLIRPPVVSRELLTTTFYTNLLSGIVLAVLVAALGGPLSDAYHQPVLRAVMAIAGLQMALNVTVVPTALLERAYRFRALAMIEVSAILVATGASVGMAIAGCGAVSIVVGPAAGFALQSVTLWLVVKLVPHGRPTRRAAREIWRYSGPLMIFNTLVYWARNIDNLVLGITAGAFALGMYSRAYVLMLVPVEQIIVVLGRVLLPVLSRQLGSISDMRSTYVRALRLSSAVMIPTGVGLACLAVPVVSVLFGAKWHGMSEILAILAVTTPVQVVVVTCGPIYQAFGATRAWSRRAAVTAVATMIALCTGAFFGAIGVAVGFAVSSFATAPYAVRLPWQMIGLSARNGIKTVRAELFASALMACWLVGFGHVAHAWGGVAWLASGVISGAAVYVTALAVIEPAVITELKRAITKHSS